MHTDMGISCKLTVLGLGFVYVCVLCSCYGQFIYVRVSYFVFSVFPLCYCLVVSTSAINCLERLVSEMTYYVSTGLLNPTHSLTGL